MNFNNRDAFPSILNSANENKKSLEIEIGSGNGHFLVEYSKRKPKSFVVGIEFKKQRCEKIQKKINRAELKNSFLIYDDAQKIVDKLEANTIDAFHIYFPDPWPKSKHRKRRFLRAENLNKLCIALRPKGRIYFVSDFFDYSLQVKILFLLNKNLKLFSTKPPPEVYLSMFASKFMELEKMINVVIAEKL